MTLAEHPTLIDPDIWRGYVDDVMPVPDETPAEFAEHYRVLHPIYCTERPGPWSNDVFPHHRHIMNMIQEAVRTGKEGVVWMKGGQVAGTDAAINCMMWLKLHLPGPQLFLTSTEQQATKFGMERFRNVINDMPALQSKRVREAREPALMHRFIDGTIDLSGGQSIFKLQSNPYRVGVVDELDSLVENLGGEGDPVELLKVRTDSFSGQTLILAYAHPTTKDRGAGKLFYESSDQRRPFVQHDCGGWFYFQQEHFRCDSEKKNDPKAWEYVCPHCGAVIQNHERVAMIRKLEYRSVLPPEVAAEKTWIGAQFGQLISPHKSLLSFFERRIKCGDDENKIRVYVNKVLGEVHEQKTQKVEVGALRQLICVKRRSNDPEFYIRGQVPPGVQFLTAGQDSRTTELHYSVWGWGLRRKLDKTTALCAWLIDWGVIKRQYSLTFDEAEYHVFDELIYRRRFASSVSDRLYHVAQCGHDIGYQPTQIPIVQYVRNWPNRAFAIKGAAETATSAVKADYMRLGNSIAVKIGDETIRYAATQRWLANTYQLKVEWYGMIDRRIEVADPGAGDGVARKVPLITLPEDVDDAWLNQSASEYLTRGDKKGEMVWRHKGPNHYGDTNTYAHGLALNMTPGLLGMTDDEALSIVEFSPPAEVPEERHDPSYS